MCSINSRVLTVLPAQPIEERWRHGRIWRGVDEISFRLSGGHWYGMGGLLHQLWPLEKISFPLTRFLTSDNGATGLLGLLEPLWICSDGLGVLVEQDDLEVGLNAPLEPPPAVDDYKQLPNSERPRRARGGETDGALTIRGENLTLYLFEKRDARAVVEAYWEGLAACAAPPRRVYERPLWTSWAAFKNDISHEAIIETAENAVRFGFSPSVFGIDAKWQREFGDTSFDRAKFPDARATVERLHALGCEATLWTVPFVMPSSEHYRTVVDKRLVFMNSDGSPYLGRWWEGESVFLDFTNPEALHWYGRQLQELSLRCGGDGFKFDAGEGRFYDVPGLLKHEPCSLNRLAKRYLSPLAARWPWCDARAGWRCQTVPLLFRQWDKKTTWGFDNGLASCITQALTLNLLGYPNSFPDMIGGNEWAGDRADAELLMRWTEAVAPMPVIQFSVPLWREGNECAEVCARYAALHGELAGRHERLAKEKLPRLRPVWWLAPQDDEALCCDDEYLVGDDLLVAPVIVPGARARDIYLPPGRWRSYWNHAESHRGPGRLSGYPAELDQLPLFERLG